MPEKYGGPFKNLHVIKLLIVIEIERTKRRDTSTWYLFSLVLKVEGCYTRLQRRSLGQQCWHNVVTIRSNVTTMLRRRCQFARVTQLLSSVLGNELGYIRVGLSALHDTFEVEIIRAVALLVPGDQLPGTNNIT